MFAFEFHRIGHRHRALVEVDGYRLYTAGAADNLPERRQCSRIGLDQGQVDGLLFIHIFIPSIRRSTLSFKMK